MKKISKEVLTYIIMLLISIILIIIGVVWSGNTWADILFNIGLSILSTVIVYFILKFCAEDPMDAVVGKVDRLSKELTESVDMLRSTKDTGIINFWNSRSDYPTREWISRISNTNGDIRILCYAMHFLLDEANFDDELARVAQAGKKVKILVGMPNGECVKARTLEEKSEGNIAERIERASARIERINNKLPQDKQIEIRYHNTPLYASIYVFGSNMLVTPQLYGTRGAKAPLIEIRDNENTQCMYKKYIEMFNEVWLVGKEKNEL